MKDTLCRPIFLDGSSFIDYAKQRRVVYHCLRSHVPISLGKASFNDQGNDAIGSGRSLSVRGILKGTQNIIYRLYTRQSTDLFLGYRRRYLDFCERIFAL